MQNLYLPIVIWRHRKENLKKCSLRGLEHRSDILFYTYPNEALLELKKYIYLSLDAPPLTEEDASMGLFIIDATWRYAQTMEKQAPVLTRRSLPRDIKTAYPRRQNDCSDPDHGLASIEALYVAHKILGRETEGLLDNYYWAEEFLNHLEATEWYY